LFRNLFGPPGAFPFRNGVECGPKGRFESADESGHSKADGNFTIDRKTGAGDNSVARQRAG